MPRKLRRRYGHAGRHQRPVFVLPQWVEETKDSCLRSVAEDAYTAKGIADGLGADVISASAGVYRAGMKSLARLEDSKLKASERCHEGDRASRKFWEAKVAARQARGS